MLASLNTILLRYLDCVTHTVLHKQSTIMVVYDIYINKLFSSFVFKIKKKKTFIAISTHILLVNTKMRRIYSDNFPDLYTVKHWLYI